MPTKDNSARDLTSPFVHSTAQIPPRFDEEHIRLAELLQAATLAAHDHTDPQILREELSSIFGYALMHFSEEENAMASANFPGLAAHREEHCKILRRLQEQLAHYDSEPWRVTLDIVDMLELWMHDHVKRVDAEYMRYMNNAF